MRKVDVRTPADAVAFLADCTLATVEAMAMKKSRPANEYRRQKAIAQSAVTWMRFMSIPHGDTRVREVEEAGGSVQAWAEKFETRKRTEPA